MTTRMVEVRAKVLKQNDLLARALRERFPTRAPVWSAWFRALAREKQRSSKNCSATLLGTLG